MSDYISGQPKLKQDNTLSALVISSRQCCTDYNFLSASLWIRTYSLLSTSSDRAESLKRNSWLQSSSNGPWSSGAEILQHPGRLHGLWRGQSSARLHQSGPRHRDLADHRPGSGTSVGPCLAPGNFSWEASEPMLQPGWPQHSSAWELRFRDTDWQVLQCKYRAGNRTDKVVFKSSCSYDNLVVSETPAISSTTSVTPITSSTNTVETFDLSTPGSSWVPTTSFPFYISGSPGVTLDNVFYVTDSVDVKGI